MALRRWLLHTAAFPVLLFSAAGFLVMGYHPGAEDDGVYLASVKARLDPALYPHDAAFFAVQMKASVFDRAMAGWVRVSGIPVAWSELLWQLAAIVLILATCWSIAGRLFSSTAARWGGMALVSAMLTLPVAGTGIYLADQYLHPRNLASALVLWGVARILAGRPLQAVLLVAGAILLHPMMGAYGGSFCLVLALVINTGGNRGSVRVRQGQTEGAAVAAVPFGWLLRPASPGWLDAMRSHHWYWLYQWEWYEWLGAIAPLVLFAVLWHWQRSRESGSRGSGMLGRFALAVLVYGMVQQGIALVVCGVPRLATLATVEPMRYLHVVYVFLTLIGGGLLGERVLRRSVVRWAVFLVAANAPLYAAQRALFSASPHVEWPGRESGNPWMQAFAWIRANTPKDALFALGPDYLLEPREDMHGFRALAERSALADAVKDGAVLSKAPELVPQWREQVDAQADWSNFQLADFERIKRRFGVGWVLLDRPAPDSLACPWHRSEVWVCRVP